MMMCIYIGVRLHWDEVSDYLRDGLDSAFQVDSEADDEDYIAKLLCQLYDDCIIQHDFNGLHKMNANRKQIQSLQAAAKEKVAEELIDDDEDEDEMDMDDIDEKQNNTDRQEHKDESSQLTSSSTSASSSSSSDISGAVSSLSLTSDAKSAEQHGEDKAEEEAGWTTVRNKGRGSKR